MRLQRGAENDSISSIPSALRTCPIAKHLHAQLNSISNFAGATARKPLAERDHRKGCRNDPADCARKPRPSRFVGIKLHCPVHGLEFPFPKPVTFAAFVRKEPRYRFLKVCELRVRKTKRDKNRRGCPASFSVIAIERRRMLDNRAGSIHSKRSEEHTSELQSRLHLVCRLLLEKKKKNKQKTT